MTAIGFAAPGGPEVLQPRDAAPCRSPARARSWSRSPPPASTAPTSCSARAATRRRPAPPTSPASRSPARSWRCGEGATRFAVGDRVCALVAGGGYAEYAVVHESNALPVPTGLSLIEAGAIPETFFTVWTNVFERGRLQAGESFLVHGGSSGIGTTAIQLAKAFGATVLATAGSAENAQACRELGADLAINYRDGGFRRGGEGRRPAGAASTSSSTWSAATTSTATTRPPPIERPHRRRSPSSTARKAEVDFGRLMLKRLTHTGSTLRPAHHRREGRHRRRRCEAKVWPLLEAGRCKPRDRRDLPARARPRRRTALMESSAHIGKIVLTMC